MKKIGNYIIYFFLYAIVGWIYEVFLEVVVYKWGFSNRGVLFGPWLPVYVFGALIFLFTAYPLIKNKKLSTKLLRIPLVFLICMFSATLLELITSYICEFFMGSWPWQTYADYKINFQARIALSPSIRFGIGGVAFLYLVQPLLEKLCNKLGPKKVKLYSVIILIVLALDMLYSFVLKKFI
jgi:uncharacterized membrane protein